MVEVRISELAVEKLKNGKKVKFAVEIPMLPEFKNKLRPENDKIYEITGEDPMKRGESVICLGSFSESGNYSHRYFSDCYIVTKYKGKEILIPLDAESEELLYEKFGDVAIDEVGKKIMYEALERGD